MKSSLPAYPEAPGRWRYAIGSLGWLLEIYLRNEQVAKETRRKYWFTMQRHFSDWFSKSAESVTANEVKGRYERIVSERSEPYAYSVSRVLSSVYKHGMEEAAWFGIKIHENPADGIPHSSYAERKKPKRFRKMPIEKILLELPRWVTAVVSHRKDTALRDGLLLSLFTGLSPSRMRLIAWKDVSLTHRLLSVRERDGETFIPISAYVAGILSERQRQALQTDVLVFPEPSIDWNRVTLLKRIAGGTLLDWNDLRNVYMHFAKKVGVSGSDAPTEEQAPAITDEILKLAQIQMSVQPPAPTQLNEETVQAVRNFYAINRSRFEKAECGYLDRSRNVVFFFDAVFERMFGLPAHIIAGELNTSGALYRDSYGDLKSRCEKGRFYAVVESFLLEDTR